MKNTVKVVIADDHALVREAFKKIILDSNVADEVIEAKNGLEALMKAKEAKPDLIILDYDMPVYNAIYTCNELSDEGLEIPVLIVTMHNSKEFIISVLKAGARGFLPKEAKSEELLDAIRALLNGKKWFKGSVAEIIAEDYFGKNLNSKQSKKDKLTIREREIVGLLTQGKTSAGIAEVLHISPRTVEVHKSRIYKKMGVNNIASLLRMTYLDPS